MDQSSFAAPHGLSQRITSFFACACQGIHQMPLRHLIVLIANAHHLLDLVSLSFSLALEGRPNLTIRSSFLCRSPARDRATFTTPPSHDAIDVFDRSALLELRRAARLQSILRPASRDQIRDRAVRQRPSDVPSEIFSLTRVRTFRSSLRGGAKRLATAYRPTQTSGQQLNIQSDKLPTYSDPSFVSGRLGHQRHHWNRHRTS